MPMIVVKKFLVDTESVDEAHEFTKPTNDKVETLEVGGIKPFVEPQSTVQSPPAKKSQIPPTTPQ